MLLGCGVAALLFLVLAVACAVVVLSGDPDGTAPEGQPGGGAEEGGDASAESVGIGEPGTVGQWQVTVNGIETADVYGDDFVRERAQGEFTIVSMTVKNTGNEATSFDGSAVSLVDADGNTYSSSTMLFQEESLLHEQVNPGNQVSGTAVFDAPEGTEITEIHVEDVWSFEEPLVIRAE
ncbi:hypothetical protein A6A08_22760 [Nocardiopsis sp. TSRI0078]|nr:hypothetical protein A6A08_22760 [Nocardiopsis sp. TSRI0078]